MDDGNTVGYDDDGRRLGEILEELPDSVVASLEVRDAWRRQLAESNVGLEFIVADLQAWPVGSVVRVAFLDGDTALHADVAGATGQIADAMNLTLDFGLDAATGTYRRWTLTDTQLQAEIRVSFDMGGYWSLVGTDSTDTTIDPAGGPIGGLPNQRSLNLGGYKVSKPQGWEGTVRHEFLHALAFKHEHQNFRGPCEDDFRWENDPGYVPTKDARGVFVPDAQGRRPGIYTYLAGEPNRWSKAKVDHNLRTKNDPNAVMGPFDAASVMLYRFAPFFYKSSPSACAPTGPGQDLSDGDKRGLDLLYPASAEEVARQAEQAQRGLELVGSESRGADASVYDDRLLELLDARSVVAD
ncbi:MAG: hypothetical protein ABWY26_03340 [Microbacterium sp.]